MNFPTLPTDNLYKFLAISGLIMFLLSVYFPLDQLQKLELKRINVASRIKLLEFEFQEIKEEVLSIDEDLKNEFRMEYGDSIFLAFIEVYETKDLTAIVEFIEHLKEMEHKGLIVAEEQDTIRTYNRIVRSLKARDKLRKNQIKTIEVAGSQAELRALMSYAKTWITICRVGTYAGIIIMIIGFVLWYVLWQRPQDQLLKRQLNQASDISS